MNTTVNIEQLQKEADATFHSGFTCAETVIYTINKAFDLGMPESAIAMSSGFPWGLGGGGCICGALAGATMCIGYLYGRTTPGDPKVNRCFELTHELHDAFKSANGGTCCRVLTRGLEKNSPERKANCANIVYNTIEMTAKILMRELEKDKEASFNE